MIYILIENTVVISTCNRLQTVLRQATTYNNVIRVSLSGISVSLQYASIPDK